jgi:hypothetical protein
MTVFGALTGFVASVAYFSGVKNNYLGESVVIGIIWLEVNLDHAMV